jgi:hypothetical protein
VALAARLGVAPRRLWGWEPRTFTEHIYEDGLLVGTVSQIEPEFDDEQRALLLAYELHTASVGPHGFLMSEVTSPEADPNNAAGSLRFVADSIPTVDYAEKARRNAEEAYRKNYEGADMAGLIFRVHREER